MPRVRLRPLALALATAVAAPPAGCASGGTTTIAGARPAHVAMAEFRLSPQELVVAEGPRTLIVRNAGTMVHRFEIRGADGGPRIVLGRHLRPGAAERIALALAPGEYVIRCTQEGHHTLGEHGTLRVR